MPPLIRLPRATTLAAIVTLAGCTAAGSQAIPRGPLEAPFRDATGRDLGTATFTQLTHGVLLRVSLRGLTPGAHGIHLHQRGRCEAGTPAFESAGGHTNPTSRAHGWNAPNGQHQGDLPNLVVAGDGTASAEFVVAGARLGDGTGALTDADGVSVIVHAKADDHRTDPSGDSGDRVACAAFAPGTDGR
jgi:Cu-Zn family superoxide dismutase